VIDHTFAWWDSPEAFNARWEDGYTLPTALTSARPCRLNDLGLVANAGPGLGTVYAGLELHNTSATACEVQGSPRVELLDAHGIVRQSSGPTDSGFSPKVVVLIPNSWARTEGGWAIAPSCAGTGSTTTVRVWLAGQDSSRDIPWASGTQEASRCPASRNYRPRLRLLGVTPLEAIPTEPDDTGDLAGVRGLSPALRVPASVERGSTLHYQLLQMASGTNGGGVDDQVCPLYSVRLAGAGGTYELRCDETINLKQWHAVLYDLQLKVPSVAPLGTTTLTWQFLEPALPALTAPIAIVR
jgi:hypothetical protein